MPHSSLIQKKVVDMHKRAREHKRLVRLSKAVKRWKRSRKHLDVQFKGEFEWVWEGEVRPAYLPKFPMDAKDFEKIQKEIKL